MSWYIKCLKQYVDFSGRARRKEYWMWTLVNMIISIILVILSLIVSQDLETYTIFDGIANVYSLLVFLPGLAVTVRRLHDIGRSGWWFLVFIIPIVGWILAIIWLTTDSQAGNNQYGSNPKEVEAVSKL